ncbi:MAG: nitrogen regulatory protein 2 [Desulfovibrionales bacterium]|jgi:nitrogen regulatory protein PII 2|nr:nitrogen regulatory protein 2 [Desulfovibrionales bacterium]
MKEVMAVIRMNKMNATKAALTEIGVNAFVGNEAQGRGKGLVPADLLEGAKQGYEEAAALLGEPGRLYPKRVLSVVVPNEQVQPIIEALIKVNATGNPGDGKIFVMPVSDSVRVRTNERGEKAVI